MSYLTPDKRPVGYSLTRQRAERGYRREDLPRFESIPDAKWKLPLIAARFVGRDLSIAVVTEGCGGQPFHGRIAVLVNEHTAGSGEMVAGFVRENGLGTIVGMKTAGRLLGGKGFKLGGDYVLMLPVGAYMSWEGKLYEGTGVEPDTTVDWSRATPGRLRACRGDSRRDVRRRESPPRRAGALGTAAGPSV